MAAAAVNPSSTGESAITYFHNQESSGTWTAFVVVLGVTTGGASLAEHSWTLTSSLLLGTLAVWYIGHRVLSKTTYFISPTMAGFKDSFRARQVQFDEIVSVTKFVTRGGITVEFSCTSRNVSIPIDSIDDGTWYAALKAELQKRGVTISFNDYGFKRKTE